MIVFILVALIWFAFGLLASVIYWYYRRHVATWYGTVTNLSFLTYSDLIKIILLFPTGLAGFICLFIELDARDFFNKKVFKE